MEKTKLNPYEDPTIDAESNNGPKWNFDPRNENYYLGKINESGNTDPDMSYYTDGESDRYYRRNELKINTDPDSEIVHISKPYINNNFEGRKRRKYIPKWLHRKKTSEN
ncbi:MAG: hypothetical protein ABI372_00885 [Ginsengibacter sp.]